MKQTAVEWLEQEFIKLEATIGVHGVMYELIEKAKEMEKQQTIDFAYKCRNLMAADELAITHWYNKTYKEVR